ncbi:Mco1 [Bugula neritina]|uniref:Mco1 n=1 Tax=Bugula neritina TaxID=10212 RepID=A0A7J7J6D2_BUGNE|nr:Mco1 [Bugula neritina]
MDEELGKFEVGNPPLKDNLLIPIGGYAVVRFYTDNPGYWLAHCHQVSHLYSGMAMVFDVDGATARSTVPSNFPTCGDFLLTPSS